MNFIFELRSLSNAGCHWVPWAPEKKGKVLLREFGGSPLPAGLGKWQQVPHMASRACVPAGSTQPPVSCPVWVHRSTLGPAYHILLCFENITKSLLKYKWKV